MDSLKSCKIRLRTDISAWRALIALSAMGCVGSRAAAAVPCASLQSELLTSTVLVVLSTDATCGTQPDITYAGDTFDAVLLIPEGKTLDLNGKTLSLAPNGESTYGIRLARNATLRNGRVAVTESTGISNGIGIFHSAVSVGSYYGLTGTPAAPRYFASIGGWTIENVQVAQPFPRAVIQVIGDAYDGLIDRVTIESSSEALLGIGLDWGDVGGISSVESNLVAQKARWIAGEAYTTHPHDIVIQNISVYGLTRQDEDDRAAIRTSAVHDVTIRNVWVQSAGSGIVLRAGDLGYEYARPADRAVRHSGLVVEGFTIEQAYRRGVIVDGLADNVYRAHFAPQPGVPPYDWFIDPREGFPSPSVRFGVVRGKFYGLGSPPSAVQAQSGVFVQYADQLVMEDVNSQEFAQGLSIRERTRNSTFWRSNFRHNLNYGIYLRGETEYGQADTAPDNIAIVNDDLCGTTGNQLFNSNGTNVVESGSYCSP